MTLTLLSRREVPFATEGEDTHGLRVIREDWTEYNDTGIMTHWKYDLPDGVVVFGLTTDKKVIAIKKWQPGIGEYPQIPAETLEPGELAKLRAALADKNDVAVEGVAVRVARRCLFEETGYTAETVRLLTVLSQHSGKTPMVHCFCLAEGCTKAQSEGSGQKEEGITLLPPAETTRIWEALTKYVNDRPTEPHGGKNSIVAAALAMEKVGALRVEPIPEFRGTPTVVALRGLPLSGKSTLARGLVEKFGWHLIDVDDMRHVGAGEPNRSEVPNPWLEEASKQKEGEDMRIAYTLMHEAVRANINLGRSVIVVATYSRQPAQQFLLDIVKAHPGARLKGIRCVFNDTLEEVERRIAAKDRGRGGCKTVEHYFIDKNERHDYTDLWGVCEVNTSEPPEACVKRAAQFIAED